VAVSTAVGWDGDDYQRRFDELAARGVDVHGEARFVEAFGPRTVLDAGCGTGRVAVELARRGISVTGVDVDPAMLATARRAGAAAGVDVEWIEHDLTTLDLGRTCDVVLLAGNVPLFTAPGTQAALIERCAAHGGIVVAGFSLDRGYDLARYDADCAAAGLVLRDRYATWDRQPFVDDGDYAVTVSDH
jgi:SAM-dependent methyltransferase